MTSRLISTLVQIKQTWLMKADPFLRDISGVIHVGANSGLERGRYNRFGLDVLWVEPIPEIFAELERNIIKLPRQRALQALVTDTDGKLYEFHIANNNGLCKSNYFSCCFRIVKLVYFSLFSSEVVVGNSNLSPNWVPIYVSPVRHQSIEKTCIIWKCGKLR